jgi:hypothetical protein
MQSRWRVGFLKIVIFMKDSGRMSIEVGKECKFGKMDPSMRDTGSITSLMGLVGSYIVMEMCIWASGRMIGQMGKECIFLMVEVNMMVNG